MAALRILMTACVIGVVAFLAGFVGPMVFTPGANQGPLLGLFITGPVGFAIGLGVGWWREKIRD